MAYTQIPVIKNPNRRRAVKNLIMLSEGIEKTLSKLDYNSLYYDSLHYEKDYINGLIIEHLEKENKENAQKDKT